MVYTPWYFSQLGGAIVKSTLTTIIAGLLLSLGSAQATTITAVMFYGSVANPMIQIIGTGFLPMPATDGLASPAGIYSGYDYGRELYLFDQTAGWDAGCGTSAPTGCHDFIGFANLNYTDTVISMTYGSEYQFYYPSTNWHLNQGDQYLLHVHEATFSGAVNFVPEPASSMILGTGLCLLLVGRSLSNRAKTTRPVQCIEI